MKTQIRSVLKISSIYVASTIGAAFASGQEIIKFFTRFEVKSYPGVILAGILFVVVAVAALDLVYSHRTKSSGELLHILGGRYVGKLLEAISLAFTFCVYMVMIAGAAALWERLTGYSHISGVILFTIVCTLLISSNMKGILAVCEIITPLMIVGMLYLGCLVILRDKAAFGAGNPEYIDFWLVYAFLYVCYNSILNILVMGSLGSWLKNRKTGIYAGILGGLALLLATWVLNQALLINWSRIQYSELPMVELSLYAGKWGLPVYSFILFFALLSTAISAGFCCVERLNQIIRKPCWVINICMGLLVIPLSKQGFSMVIDRIYPLFGCLGALLFVLLIFQWIKLLIARIMHMEKPGQKPWF